MGYYTFYDNACRPYYVQEPPLEPPDCWRKKAEKPEEEYDRWEEEENNGKARRP